MNKEYIKNIIIDQREDISEQLKNKRIILRNGIKECKKYIKHPNLLLISGLRRAGKSVFAHLLKEKDKYSFLNFDDERLIQFTAKDFNNVLECFYELYRKVDYILFDEIQNIKGWELFINRLRNRYKVIITGSNANLLSRELATHLTGRYLEFVLFPMSFEEFLRFSSLTIEKDIFYSTQKKSKITQLFHLYIKQSGIFEFYQFGREFLRKLWSSVITKDIIARYQIKYPHILEELALILANSFSSKVSVNNLSKHLQVKSSHTISEYIKYLENSFLIFTVNKFSYKLKEQLSSFKKIYITDHGFINALSVNFSENKGRLLENIVAIELKRHCLFRNNEFFYWDNYHFECDFVIKRRKQIVSLYQVCAELNINNKKREIAGLVGAMKEFGLKKGYILTESQEDEIRVNNYKISIR